MDNVDLLPDDPSQPMRMLVQGNRVKERML